MGIFKVAEDLKFAVCLKCLKEVPRGGDKAKVFTTSNLVNHLWRHSEEYKKYEEMKVTAKEKETSGKQTTSESKLKQVTLALAEDMCKVWDINDARAKTIHIKIAEMIALDCQPYSVVDDIGFRALIHALEPRYNVPSRRYFSETMIPSIVDRMACINLK